MVWTEGQTDRPSELWSISLTQNKTLLDDRLEEEYDGNKISWYLLKDSNKVYLTDQAVLQVSFFLKAMLFYE